MLPVEQQLYQENSSQQHWHTSSLLPTPQAHSSHTQFQPRAFLIEVCMNTLCSGSFSHANCFPQPFPGLPILCPQTPHAAAGHAVSQAPVERRGHGYLAKLWVLPQTRRSAWVSPGACSASACSVLTPGFPASHPAAALFGERRHKELTCYCKPSHAQHGTRGCGKGSREIPASSQKSSLQSRSATLPPAGGEPGAAGRSRSGRRCWWRGPHAPR